METYKAVALSTGHLRESDAKALSFLVGTDQLIMERDTGFFVKLMVDTENKGINARPELSPEFNRIIQWASEKGFALIEFDGAAETVDIFPTFDW